MKRRLIVLLAVLSASGLSQTNRPGSITNIVSAHPDFRIVGGQLYNIRRSVLWKDLSLVCIGLTNGFMLARVFTNQPVYETRQQPASPGNNSQRANRYARPNGTSGGDHKTKIGTERVLLNPVAIRNLETGNLVTDQEILIRAMRTGSTNLAGSLIAIWDCGLGYGVITTTQNQKPGTNVAVYVSEQGEVVTASYDIQGGRVQVILPDKSRVNFHQAISASGARYTNEARTFWEHQGEATYSIGDRIVFVGKVKSN